MNKYNIIIYICIYYNDKCRTNDCAMISGSDIDNVTVTCDFGLTNLDAETKKY